MYQAVVKLDRDLAQDLFGYKRGRPTISKRAGDVIGPALGVSKRAGKDIFHAAVIVGGLVVVAKYFAR